MTSRNFTPDQTSEWDILAHTYQLDTHKLSQFKIYLELLQTWNKNINLTAIQETLAIIQYHFYDSLSASRYISLNEIASVADIGAGAGFPGLPLKIMYPHIKLFLIEVNQKKVKFLQTVIDQLALSDVHIYFQDWRTFLRTTSYPIDLFVARASLQISDMFRIFRSSSPYNNALLAYWASSHWKPENAEQNSYVVHQWSYQVDSRVRKLVLFKRP